LSKTLYRTQKELILKYCYLQQHPEDMCVQYNAVRLWNMDSYKTLRKPNPVLWEKMLPEDSKDRMETKGH